MRLKPGARILVAILGAAGLAGALTVAWQERYSTSASGLRWKVIRKGAGPKPKTGQRVSTHYTLWLWEGWFSGGDKIDSSLDRGQAFSFDVGLGQVIRGWDEAVLDMEVGERRKLIIPPALGYGSSKAGLIPPGSTLYFEIELIEILGKP